MQRELCIQMWNILAETGSVFKYDALDQMNIPINQQPFANCFACETADNISITHNKITSCHNCPIDWTPEGGYCQDPNSPYYKWDHATDNSTRKYYAREIVSLIINSWPEGV